VPGCEVWRTGPRDDEAEITSKRLKLFRKLSNTPAHSLLLGFGPCLMVHDHPIDRDTSANNEYQCLKTTHSCVRLLAKPLCTAARSGLTHEVPLRDVHHRLRSLRNVEAYRSAVAATVSSVLIQSECSGIKDGRLRSARSTSQIYVPSMNRPITDAVSAFRMPTELSSPGSIQEGEVRTLSQSCTIHH
jgi:hypothetical protein